MTVHYIETVVVNPEGFRIYELEGWFITYDGEAYFSFN